MSDGSAGRAIFSFFTFVAPSHGNKAGNVVAPDKGAGKQPCSDHADNLEALLAILFAKGRDDQVIVIRKDGIAERPGKPVLLPVAAPFAGSKRSSLTGVVRKSRTTSDKPIAGRGRPA